MAASCAACDVYPLLLAAGELALDGPTLVRIVSRALHIMAAIVLGGGLFYMRTVLAPAGSDACFAGRRETWARWAAVASVLLLATGVYNLIVILGDARADGGKLPPAYHALFGVKVLLGLGVMFAASLVAGRTGAAERARASLGTWVNAAWYAVLAIVVIGATLRMFH